MLGWPISHTFRSEASALAALHDVFKWIIRDGLGVARYEYEPTGETHKPTGEKIYRVIRDGHNTEVRVLAPCFDPRGIEWLGDPDIYVGFGVYFHKYFELKSGISIAWGDSLSGGRFLHMPGKPSSGSIPIYYSSKGVTLNANSEKYPASPTSPNFGDVLMYDGSYAENLYLVTGKLPVLFPNTVIKNLQVSTHAPMFASGISIDGAFGNPEVEEVSRRDVPMMVNDVIKHYSVPLHRDTQSDTRYLVMGPVGSDNETLTAMLADDGVIYVTRGCFEGTLKEFQEAVEHTYGRKKSQFGSEYQAIIEVIKARFPNGAKERSPSTHKEVATTYNTLAAFMG